MSVNAATNNSWKPKIVAFCCNWCSYAGADLAGISRFKQPSNMRIVRVPCSGRVNPVFVLRAFQQGADGVLVAGCHPGDCHYATGNYYTRRRFLIFKKLLEYVGLEPERFQARWISGAEGQKFADTTINIVEDIKPLGPNKRMRFSGI